MYKRTPQKPNGDHSIFYTLELVMLYANYYILLYIIEVIIPTCIGVVKILHKLECKCKTGYLSKKKSKTGNSRKIIFLILYMFFVRHYGNIILGKCQIYNGSILPSN